MPLPDLRKIADLKRALAALDAPAAGFAAAAQRITFGADFVDDAIGGGLPAAALHEIYPAGDGDGAAASAFALALMLRAAPGRKIVWIRQDMAARELGELYPPGLAEFGADPDAILIVQARDAVSALRAGNEALRCSALGAVAIEIWGGEKAADLTATRRINRAADAAGTTALLIRLAAEPVPSAASSRWRVRTAASASLIADAPGASRFDIELVRHRAGFPPRSFCVEWDRDECVFRKPALSRFVAAVSADRPAASDQTPFRRAG
jgi:protein ImuA